MARVFLICAWLLAVAAILPAAHAQTGKWPDKTVRMVVPLAPGGGTDIVARLFAARLTAEFGQQFISDNRSGAGGTIGAEIAARANPDGYTVITVPASYAANAALYKLPYDPVRGIAPVALIATGPLILTVHPSVPATGLKEFIALARAKPRTLNFGSSGSGSFSHLAAELFRQLSGTDMVHVPYKSAGPALIDLLGGQIQIFFGSGPSTGAHIRAGRLRGIAVTTRARSALVAGLPGMEEAGLAGYNLSIWYGFFAPAATPHEIVMRLFQATAQTLQDAKLKEVLARDGTETLGSRSPDAFAAFLREEAEVTARVIRESGAKFD